MLKEILQKRSKIEVHFSSKNTKKGRIHQQDKPPHTNASTQLATYKLLYSIGGALPLPLSDKKSLCAIAPNT